MAAKIDNELKGGKVPCLQKLDRNPFKPSSSLSVPNINIADFDYPLPETRIAQYPLAERDASKLLVYKDKQCRTTPFRSLPEELPPQTVLVVNDTQVIHARLRLQLPNGHPLELFCLRPIVPAAYDLNLSAKGPVEWDCLVGGNRRWKSGQISGTLTGQNGPIAFQATRLEALGGSFRIRFEWDAANLTFGDLLAAGGQVPLPPYLNRAPEATDKGRYQTVFSSHQGSVAAPTAGLHFTPSLLDQLAQRGVPQAPLTLHVGAGTFRPVTTDSIADHRMHFEFFRVARTTIEQLLDRYEAGTPCLAVGTTSLRTLESLYWIGQQLATEQAASWLHEAVSISQELPYRARKTVSVQVAFSALAEALRSESLAYVEGDTQLLIAPGYPLRTISGLITNFHQPRSTLLLLVAALVGPAWKDIYAYALANEYRFLSYGDSSLLWK